MTVATLIAFLQTQPPARLVLTAYYDGNAWDETLRFTAPSPIVRHVRLASDGDYSDAGTTDGVEALVL